MRQTPAEKMAKTKPPKTFKTARGVTRKFECAVLSLRDSMNLTVRDVADGSGVNMAQVCRIEHGMNLTLTNALKLARFFGKPIEEIWKPLNGTKE